MIKAARLKKGMTQWELAQRLGYSSSQFISNIERGLCGIPPHWINLIPSILGITKTELRTEIMKRFERRLK